MSEGEGQAAPAAQLQPPFDTDCDWQIKKVEVKRQDEGTKGPYTILKVGVIAPNGWRGWVEIFHPGQDQSKYPAEGSTRKGKLERPKKPEYLPSLRLARAGGGGGGYRGGGGGSPRDPIEEAARQAMIVAQHSQSAAIAELALLDGGIDPPQGMDEIDAIRAYVNERSAELTDAALEIGNVERAAAKQRKGAR